MKEQAMEILLLETVSNHGYEMIRILKMFNSKYGKLNLRLLMEFEV